MWENVKWFGLQVFTRMEKIGQTVSGMLGLEDSYFQDVIDSFDESDLKRVDAIQVSNYLQTHVFVCTL